MPKHSVGYFGLIISAVICYLRYRMRKFLILLPLLASCGIFKKKPQPVLENQTAFQSVNYPLIHDLLAIDYVVSQNKEQTDFSVFPLSNAGYNFDFLYGGDKNTFKTLPANIQNKGRYWCNFENGVPESDGNISLWLSKFDFMELMVKGSALLDLGLDGIVNFTVKGVSDFRFILSDTELIVKTVELIGSDKPYYISFIPDPDYPLIVHQEFSQKFTLSGGMIKEPEFSTFKAQKGVELQYKMVEAGVNEYEILLRNILWTNEKITFNVSGKYTSESYSYDFNYDVIFKGKAIHAPNFLIPVFSAIKGEKVEDEANWLFLNKKEIAACLKDDSAVFSIPHYADDPRDFPDEFEDSSEYHEALREFENSHRTMFYLDRLGRIKHAEYMYYDKDWNENLMLPVLTFKSYDYGMELLVHTAGEFPLLVYFDDGSMYEIILESARKSTE